MLGLQPDASTIVSDSRRVTAGVAGLGRLARAEGRRGGVDLRYDRASGRDDVVVTS